MPTVTAAAETLHSPEFIELQSLFLNLAQPYGADEIARFNRLYKRIYGCLSLPERHRAEEFVDELIAGVEREELARRIFGVV
jgi:hypothetical protein